MEIPMSIGLFLDVDNTLTKGFIQQHFAKMVGVEEEYLEIEKKYELSEITSDSFGSEIIELFNRTKFDEQFARDNFLTMPLKDSAAKMLKLRSNSIELYFVSSGPSYYVQILAEKFNIPSGNVLCSEYIFDRGKLMSCNAVGSTEKSDFRREMAKAHDLTIGVGDDPTHDAPFLAGCDIGLLVPKEGRSKPQLNNENLWVPRLALVCSLVKNLDNKLKMLAGRTDSR
jgi:phosphoserine phosphatase